MKQPFNQNEKRYIHVLRHLFSISDERAIKGYISDFDENHDVFMEKLKELVNDDEIDIIKEMIYDDDLLSYAVKDDNRFDAEKFEEYLYSGNYNEDDPLEEISDEDEFKEININSKDPLDDLLGIAGK